MPDAFVNTAFTYTLTPVRNTGSVTFAACGAASMNLPPGMTLSAGGVLSGTPTASGNYALNFSVSDSARQYLLHADDPGIRGAGHEPRTIAERHAVPGVRRVHG